MILGFYDGNGVFFYEYDSSRPDEHYSYALANGHSIYALRHNGKERRFRNPQDYERHLKAARAGRRRVYA